MLTAHQLKKPATNVPLDTVEGRAAWLATLRAEADRVLAAPLARGEIETTEEEFPDPVLLAMLEAGAWHPNTTGAQARDQVGRQVALAYNMRPPISHRDGKSKGNELESSSPHQYDVVGKARQSGPETTAAVKAARLKIKADHEQLVKAALGHKEPTPAEPVP